MAVVRKKCEGCGVKKRMGKSKTMCKKCREYKARLVYHPVRMFTKP